jgi:hypothetical protein
MNLGKVALLGLATYRATKLIMEDEILRTPREWVEEKVSGSQKLSYFIYCPWCISIWVGGVLVILDKTSPEFSDLAQKILASSAITGLLDTNL